MHIRRALIFLCLVIAVGAQRELRVTCYLDVLTPRTHEEPCTHIIVPLTWTDDGFNFQRVSEEDCDVLGKMKSRNPTLKILVGLEIKASSRTQKKIFQRTLESHAVPLMFGDQHSLKYLLLCFADGRKSYSLGLMITGQSRVENIIHTLLSYLKEKSFDGLDLTWMNGPISDQSSNNTEPLISFLKRIKAAFEDNTHSSDRTLLLSLSLSIQSDQNRLIGYDMRTVLQYVDFISLFPAHLEKDGMYINDTIQHWQDEQVDLLKLNLALPAFLRRRRNKHHPSNSDKNTEDGNIYHEMGLNLATQVCQAIKNGKEFITLTSHPDEKSLVEELSWLLQKGFGGVGVVFIDIDVFFDTECNSITKDERATVESRMIIHHGCRFCGKGGHHHHHGHHGGKHHRVHRQHHKMSHRSHDIGHHHRKIRQHHRHGHHGHDLHHHHHHHHHPNHYAPTLSSTEKQLHLE